MPTPSWRRPTPPAPPAARRARRTRTAASRTRCSGSSGEQQRRRRLPGSSTTPRESDASGAPAPPPPPHIRRPSPRSRCGARAPAALPPGRSATRVRDHARPKRAQHRELAARERRLRLRVAFVGGGEPLSRLDPGERRLQHFHRAAHVGAISEGEAQKIYPAVTKVLDTLPRKDDSFSFLAPSRARCNAGERVQQKGSRAGAKKVGASPHTPKEPCGRLALRAARLPCGRLALRAAQLPCGRLALRAARLGSPQEAAPLSRAQRNRAARRASRPQGN